MKLTKLPLNKFLQSRAEVNQCEDDLIRAGLKPHGLQCKCFDIRNIVPYLEDVPLIDLGAAGSFVIHNHHLLGFKSRRVGIDLVPVAEHDRINEAEYFVGPLTKTPFADGEFGQVCSISVLEHEVEYSVFAKEVSRLLKPGGDCFVSFDYCEPKVDTSKTKLFSLDWNILSKENVMQLCYEMQKVGLKITSDIDWTTNEWVINPSYCSPADVSYTFGLLHFKKD